MMTTPPANFLLGVPLACIVIPCILVAVALARGMCAVCGFVLDLAEYVGRLTDE